MPEEQRSGFEPYVMTERARQAERALEMALYNLRSGNDPLPDISAAEAALQIDQGELSADELELHPPDDPCPECGTQLRGKNLWEGGGVECPGCGYTFCY